MLDSNNDDEIQKEIRGILRDFFSPLKKNDSYLRFLFLTGISKFSQMSIFSELNNLQNISMRDDYSAICGITEQELRTQLQIDIEQMAQANNETFEEACIHLKQQYDGYHFSENCEDIYNPFSLFNAFAQKKYANFWFSTGTPTYIPGSFIFFTTTAPAPIMHEPQIFKLLLTLAPMPIQLDFPTVTVPASFAPTDTCT